ncbi:alpha/beta hydrolase fold domain-containing protein [Actinomadura fibrosa]|uniref:Alpha/beta hydrolase fold domain-containing protein n=1 Tax=Actinomadura fibrosa TaxID=111802 RepID=A0ABW2XJI1_9ACTN|nr:alpha/beta hydrolase fold domain-containing protein [Actinomadura fibrosa]
MTTSADVHLRGASGPVRVHARWPAVDEPGVLLILHVGGRCPDTARPDVLVLDVCLEPPHESAVRDAEAVLGWIADHAAELGADPGRLAVAGRGAGAAVAADVVRAARGEGWPEVVLETDERTSI